MIIHITQLPSADTGDFSEVITVTLNVSGNVPPTNSSVIATNGTASDPLYWLCVNLTIMPNVHSHWMGGKYHKLQS